MDFQLGAHADTEVEKTEVNIRARLQRMFPENDNIEIVWASVYTFRCRRLDSFVLDRLIFAGDAAHQVSPFGGRGGNGGIQDADNLAWKLALALRDPKYELLISTYDSERIIAADENILNSTRTATFITPPDRMARILRDAALFATAAIPAAAKFVNSGRLSVPAVLGASALNYRGVAQTMERLVGSAFIDAPLRGESGPVWLTEILAKNGFTVLVYEGITNSIDLADLSVEFLVIRMQGANVEPGQFQDYTGLFRGRYSAAAGDLIVIRPDWHISAVLHNPEPDELLTALKAAVLPDLHSLDDKCRHMVNDEVPGADDVYHELLDYIRSMGEDHLQELGWTIALAALASLPDIDEARRVVTRSFEVHGISPAGRTDRGREINP